MQYMLLIYSNEADEPKPGTPEFDEHIAGYMALSEDVRNKGIVISAEPLENISTATTVRVRNGKADVTDGPFAETKETLGGYYLLDCENLDEAISYAARIPSVNFGSVEIRPIMKLDP